MKIPLRRAALMLAVLIPSAARAQGTAAHLTVYDAGVAEVLEERTVELEPGLNQVQWRSLMPKAFVRTLRVTAEGAEVVRQEITYDGPEVGNQRAPVLHLALRNRGGARQARIQVDYMAPDLSWDNDYSLSLDAGPEDAPPAGATLDSWVSLYNGTGADVRAGTVDLVAGEVSLLVGGGAARRDGYAANTAQMAAFSEGAREAPPASVTGLSAFSRFRLGRDVALNSNAPVGRHPLFQGARVPIVQRLVFENDHDDQTLARGGFVTTPRGLEVRLVSRNTTDGPMPAGQVTIYARQGPVWQVVGQDRVPLTPVAGEFTVSQGRSATVFGTRRVLERRREDYRTESGSTDEKLVTRVEVVLTNRGSRPVEAFVREGVEVFGENRWTLLEPSAETERIGANAFQAKVRVPAGGETRFTYTVETR